MGHTSGLSVPSPQWAVVPPQTAEAPVSLNDQVDLAEVLKKGFKHRKEADTITVPKPPTHANREEWLNDLQMNLATSSGYDDNFPAVVAWFRRSWDERVPLEQVRHKSCHEFSAHWTRRWQSRC